MKEKRIEKREEGAVRMSPERKSDLKIFLTNRFDTLKKKKFRTRLENVQLNSVTDQIINLNTL